jgi:hypothetical protein
MKITIRMGAEHNDVLVNGKKVLDTNGKSPEDVSRFVKNLRSK